MSTLNKLSAVEAIAGLNSGDFSAEELMNDNLARVDARDNDVQAWAHLEPDRALAAARSTDRERAKGGPVGPLCGIPVGIKDIIDTSDMPTENGSLLFPGRQPTVDAACVAGLRAAGAVIMGKTVTTELANTNPSKTRNPHNLKHSPGGSSAGSGAGVADHQVQLALGTQTGGSVIRPASFNGVYGLKPTLGWIPRAGVLLQSHTLDTVGVYGGSLADIALITDCLSIPEPADSASYLAARGSLQVGYGTPVEAAPRFGFLETPAWEETHPGAQAAIGSLVESLGDACEKVVLPSPYEDILLLHRSVFGAENAHYYGPYLVERSHLLSEQLRERLKASYDVPAREYIAAVSAREIIYRSLEQLLTRYDAIISLSATGPAPLGFETTGSPNYNSPWTYLGVPTFSLPLLSVGGLPLGVTVAGPRGGEPSLIRAARWLDEFVAD